MLYEVITEFFYDSGPDVFGGFRLDSLEHDQKFIAAESNEEVIGADAGTDCLRDRDRNNFV